jgi:RNA polymerase primary sigma factor
MDIKEVSDALTSPGKHLSVDAPFASGDENSLLDVLENAELPSPDNLLNSESLKEEIERVLSVLSEREAEVIRLYFGLDKQQAHTLEEIGDKFNLTRERVRQIKEKALRRLKRTSLSEDLRTYLG